MTRRRHVFSHRLAPKAALSAEERGRALSHPAQLPEVLLRRVVRDAAQRLVQSGEWSPVTRFILGSQRKTTHAAVSFILFGSTLGF